MKRKLFLVLNYGGIGNRLPNVRADKENYLQFFHSPEGGAWDDDEIEIYENSFNIDLFEEDIEYQKMIFEPYDFIIFVFCGHGYSENGERFIEVRPDDAEDSCVSLSQIRDTCRNTRTLFIADSCLARPALYEGGGRISGVNSFSAIDTYRRQCKNLYNQLVLETPQDTFTAGFAVSVGESANDDSRGGIYSQNLLTAARESVNYLKSPQGHQYNCASFSGVHEEAASKVIRATRGGQHPDIMMSRSRYQLPFVVVPN